MTHVPKTISMSLHEHHLFAPACTSPLHAVLTWLWYNNAYRTPNVIRTHAGASQRC